jgi:hypothetical protein
LDDGIAIMIIRDATMLEHRRTGGAGTDLPSLSLLTRYHKPIAIEALGKPEAAACPCDKAPP